MHSCPACPISALDIETEAFGKDALDHIAYGRTTFVIAHRLSIVRNAYLILVLNEGRIVETGSYHVLQRSSDHFSCLLGAADIDA